MFRWLKSAADSFGRSGSWARVRREHLEREPACIACGRSKSLEVHHVVPYHADPSKELDPSNLVTVCADPCHLVHGHLMDWRHSNPAVREDCARYRAKVHNAKQDSGPSAAPAGHAS